MRKCRIIFRPLVCLLCLAAALAAGCDRSEPPPQQPKVIHKKITVPATKPATPAAVPHAPAATIKPAPKAAAPGILLAKTAPAKVKPYNPVGKVDPFEPLFRRKEPAPSQPAATVKRKKRIPHTPLEKVDLSQLKLTGIIRSPEGNKALVEESSGKGYIITVGTYIGIHGGRVTKILPDRVVVNEETENAFGKIKEVTRQLKLQKSSGE